MANQKSNVISCGHNNVPLRAEKVGPKMVLMCEGCAAALEALLGQKETQRLMLKSCMTAAEIQQMRQERENMRIQQALADAVAVAHAMAGFPRLLALPAPSLALEVA